MDNDIKYLVGLSSFGKFGPIKLKRIKQYFKNYKSGFLASANQLMAAGIEEKTAYEFVLVRPGINLEKLLEKIIQENIKIISLESKNYPKMLAEIYDPPAILYCKGNITKEDEFALAVVGTRKFSSYGQQVAEKIAEELAKNKITIISGLAYGIDSISHNAALAAGGRTIAVLGTGVDEQSVYPAANRYLANKIINSGGAIISEFPLGTPPLRHHFPQRNRIISGLSLGTLVVEAGEKSGALITARFALDQNREVFAVPGNIYSNVSKGPNNLIKQGARAVSSTEEILDTLDLRRLTSYIDNKKIMPETKEEKLIISHLGHEPIHIDELTRRTKLKTARINSALLMMEMKGMIKNLGGMKYTLAR